MRYGQVRWAQFVSRPNRFIARCRLGEEEIVCHVRNTGRCRELLLPGQPVVVERSRNPGRKTGWTLLAVRKGEMLVNLDSQAPNRVVEEALGEGRLAEVLGGPAQWVRREVTWGGSRLDFAAGAVGRTVYVEVKGVTLEREGVALFPDAPTARGARHLEELARLAAAGAGAAVVFVIQMRGPRRFAPNAAQDPAFAAALRRAAGAGVRVAAYDCVAEPDGLTLGAPVPVVLA